MKHSKHLWYRWRWVIIAISLGVIISASTITRFLKQQTTVQPNIIKSTSVFTSPTTAIDSQASVGLSNDSSILNKAGSEPKLGHFPYAEADVNHLLVISSYAQHKDQRFERLAPEAGLALMKLIYAARDEKIWIVPVSGFRDIAYQDKLFKKQIEKRGSVEAAAKLSAPPGYSEHHTGYAVDLTDGYIPKKDITYEFATTPAFQWLKQNAKEFGFELSFTENNSQGVSYEPWHWRFIGSSEALEIFKRARTISN